MKIFLHPLQVATLLTLFSCRATPPPVPAEPPTQLAVSPAIQTAEVAPVRPPDVVAPAVSKPRMVKVSVSGITIEAVLFDSRTHKLFVADQPQGPGSRFADGRAAAAELGGIAAINASFFTPKGEPLGLVVSGGKRIGSLNRASSLGSGFYVDDGRPSLIRRSKFNGSAVIEAVQAGPFLVEKRRGVSGLSNQSPRARSFIATDGGYRWLIARTGACSLSQLASALENQSLAGTKIQDALNLDGGRSSELFVASTIEPGSVLRRPFWNSAVRNYLILVPRR